MSSSLLAQLQARQQSLLQKLISHIFDSELDEANYTKAYEFCASNLNARYHSFPDVHPARIKELFEGLEDRLLQDAQFTKAKALSQLQNQLCQLDIKGANADLDWSILSLLFSLSTRPLDTEYQPTQPAADHANQQNLASGLQASVAGTASTTEAGAAGPDTQAASDDESDMGWPSSSSELSDWSQEDDTEMQPQPHHHQPNQQGPILHGTGGAGLGTDQGLVEGHVPMIEASEGSQPAAAQPKFGLGRHSQLSLTESAPSAAKAMLLEGSCIGPIRAALCSSDDLVVALGNARLGPLLPMGRLRPEDCVSDGYLAHQVLSLLLGCGSQVFEWSDSLHRYLPRQGLHVPYLSPAQLHSVLMPAALTGTHVRALHAMTALPPHATSLRLPPAMKPGQMQTALSSGFQSPRGSRHKVVAATPCLRAFLTAVQVQLRRLQQPLITLQQQNMHGCGGPCNGGSYSSSSSSSSLTLMELRDLTKACQRRIQLLYCSAQAVLAALPGLHLAAADPPPASSWPSSPAGGIKRSSTSLLSSPKPVNHRPSWSGVPATATAPATAPAVTATAALPPGAEAQASSILLDTLHCQLQQRACLGGPAHQSHQQVLLHLYLCTLVPLLEGLQSWLYNSDSQEDDLAADFFIRAADKKLSETDPAYWSSAYLLMLQPTAGAQAGRHEGATAAAATAAGSSNTAGDMPLQQPDVASTHEAACPSYLQPMADTILAAGKSLRLLRSSEKAGTAMPPPRSKRQAQQAPVGSPLKAYMTTQQHSAAHVTGHPGTSRKESKSLCQAFLSNISSYLHQHMEHGTTQLRGGGAALVRGTAFPAGAATHAAPQAAGEAAAWQQQAPAEAAAGAAGGSAARCCSLMAQAGSCLSRLEPWQQPGSSSSRQAAGSSLPAAAPLPWLPPWNFAPEAAAQDSSLQDGCPGMAAAGAGDAAAAAAAAGGVPGTPARLRPDACAALAKLEVAVSPASVLAESCAAAMDVSETPSPAHEAAQQLQQQQQEQQVQGCTAAAVEQQQEGDVQHGLPTSQQPHQEQQQQPQQQEHGSPTSQQPHQDDQQQQQGGGLNEWHSSISRGMADCHARLQRQLGAADTSGMSTLGTDLDQVQSALLPSQWLHRGCQRGSSHWFRRHVPPQQQALQQLSWLLEGACLDLPPIDLVLEHCLLPLIKQRVEDINQQLLGCLLSDWGLMAELNQLRNFYLMASPAMQAWSSWLLSSILRGRMLEEFQEYELEMELQEAGSMSEDAPLPPIDSISIMIDYKRAAKARDKQVEATRRTAASYGGASQLQGNADINRNQDHCLVELEGLQLRYQPTWLLAMIGGNQAMDSYCQAQVFLLQIQMAKLALDKTRQSSWKLFQDHCKSHAPANTVVYGRGRPGETIGSGLGALDLMYGGTGAGTVVGGLPRPLQQQQQRAGGAAGRVGSSSSSAASGALLGAMEAKAVQQEMFNFVNNLHQFVLDRLLLNAWVQLERGLDTASSLDEVAALHKHFVAELDRQCGRSAGPNGGGTQKHIWAAIIRVLDQVVRFCAAHKSAVQAAGALAAGLREAQAGGSQAGSTRHLAGHALRAPANLQDQLDTARKVMADAAAQFKQLLLYLLRILYAATLKARARTEHQQLLARVNHNGFYDSDLQTAMPAQPM